MIEDGAMNGVDAVIALHVDSSTAVGDVVASAGPASAGVDTFYAAIIGQGGHGAEPHTTVDPIYIAGHVIQALHGIVSRRIHPKNPAVVSIGSIHSGQAANIIPERVELTGTIRYMEREVQEQIHAEIKRALQVSRALGGDYELRFEIGCPSIINDAGVTELLREVAVDLLGEECLQPPDMGMGAEDFALFAMLAPGSMFLLGGKIEGDERRHHDPRFDVDERCLPIGAAILAEAALRFLRNGE
jgi:amidohydrolase